MKRNAKGTPKRDAPVMPAAQRIEIKIHVLRDIRRHARSSMSAEICGVLVGAMGAGATVVEASIAGEEARQGGSHVTFTQETWNHIYQVKDAQFPDKRIVGWYHSHPGFGIFLSEHDTFIHRNFFSDPGQIAWVYDPHSDEEGCFAWQGGDIQRVREIGLRDEPAESAGNEIFEPMENSGGVPDELAPSREGRSAVVVRWVGLTLSHLFVLVLGLVAGLLVVSWLTAPQVAVPSDPGPGIVSPAPEEGHKK